MRDEAPIYYDEQEDFYALTRHADVAAAFKDHEAFSSARGCDLGMVRSDEVPQKSIIFMDPPDHRHMRSLLNKAFTPRAIQSQRETVIELVEHYLGKADPDNFDVVQDFSGPFPVEVITRMAGVPEDFRQQVRHWIDKGLHRKPGQIELSDDNMQANIDSGMYYYGLVQERRQNPQDDMISRLDRRGDSRRERRDCASSTTSRSPASPRLLGGAGAETVTKLVGSAVVEFAQPSRAVADAARRSQQGSRRRRGTAALRRPGAVQRPLQREGGRRAQRHDPGEQAGVPDGRIRQPRSRAPSTTARHSTSPATAPSRRTSGSATASTAASARHWPGWRPRSRWSTCWTSCRATRSTSTACRSVHMQNVAGYHHVPVKVLK